MKLKIRYNSPLILTFSILSLGVFFLKNYFPAIPSYFTSPVLNPLFALNAKDTFRLFSYTLNHADWNHLSHNLLFILLLGPILEEKYGTLKLLLMFAITSLSTVFITLTFNSNSLIGASALVYMLILLISFTNFKKGEIPLTGIIILIIFVGREIHTARFSLNTDTSYMGHIIGSLFGATLGLFSRNGPKNTKRQELSP